MLCKLKHYVLAANKSTSVSHKTHVFSILYETRRGQNHIQNPYDDCPSPKMKSQESTFRAEFNFISNK